MHQNIQLNAGSPIRAVKTYALILFLNALVRGTRWQALEIPLCQSKQILSIAVFL